VMELDLAKFSADDVASFYADLEMAVSYLHTVLYCFRFDAQLLGSSTLWCVPVDHSQ